MYELQLSFRTVSSYVRPVAANVTMYKLLLVYSLNICFIDYNKHGALLIKDMKLI